MRRRLEALLAPVLQGHSLEKHLPPAMADEDLMNALAQYLDFEPLEKLALLERPTPLARGLAMIELLEMRALMARTHGDGPGPIH